MEVFILLIGAVFFTIFLLYKSNKKYDDLMCAKDHIDLYGHTKRMERKFIRDGCPEIAKDIHNIHKRKEGTK